MSVREQRTIQIDQLLKILDVSVILLPIETSLIAYEIILITMLYYYKNRELPLKVIFSNRNFTEMGARLHLTRLVKNDWISLTKSSRDLRIKTIQPTEKLISIFEKFQSQIKDS